MLHVLTGLEDRTISAKLGGGTGGLPSSFRTAIEPEEDSHLGAGPSLLLTFLGLILNEAAPPSAVFRGWEPICGMHRAGFLSVCVTLDAPRTKSKSQEVESIVSHPLKFAEGEAASVGLMEGWATALRLRRGRISMSIAYQDSSSFADEQPCVSKQKS